MIKRPVVLIVCDGWGERASKNGNAIAAAQTPRLDALRQTWPHTTLAASGEAVGLPAGQIGNSEVGHLTIGSGRIKLQPLSRQMDEIETGTFKKNRVLLDGIALAKAKGASLHIIGLLSPGGVHSYDGTAFTLVEMAKEHGLDNIYVHAFTDGRDVAPKSAYSYLQTAMTRLREIGAGHIASVAGRYYAMDRDNRWERIATAYDMLTADGFETRSNLLDYIQSSYDEGITDEFIQPMRLTDAEGKAHPIEDGDVVIFFNFRPDRARQLSHALIDKDFTGFPRTTTVRDLTLITIAEYDSELPVSVAFPEITMPNTLAEVVSRAGLAQLHIAETEKYAHVTYFMNGGNESAFTGEDRILIPSVKVVTYDLQPEMSAPEIRNKTIAAVTSAHYDLIILNFANADMVGHTGMYDATVKAIETLDSCVGEVILKTIKAGGIALMTADHGNAEEEVTLDGQPITSHSTNPVPFLVCGLPAIELRKNGSLQDVAPTILTLLGLPQPAEMTGNSLIVPKND